MILEQFTDAAGFFRYVWQQPSGAVFHLKFKQAKDAAALAAVADEREAAEQYSNEAPVFAAPDDGVQKYARRLVELIKERPTLTAAQFNTYLNTLDWFAAVELRHTVFVIAQALAARAQVSLGGTTEAQAFIAVRNFIRDTPVRRLAKLFLNQLDF